MPITSSPIYNTISGNITNSNDWCYSNNSSGWEIVPSTTVTETYVEPTKSPVQQINQETMEFLGFGFSKKENLYFVETKNPTNPDRPYEILLEVLDIENHYEYQTRVKDSWNMGYEYSNKIILKLENIDELKTILKCLIIDF